MTGLVPFEGSGRRIQFLDFLACLVTDLMEIFDDHFLKFNVLYLIFSIIFSFFPIFQETSLPALNQDQIPISYFLEQWFSTQPQLHMQGLETLLTFTLAVCALS